MAFPWPKRGMLSRFRPQDDATLQMNLNCTEDVAPMDALAALLFAAMLLWIYLQVRAKSRRYRALAQNGIQTDAVVVGLSRRRLPKTGHRHFVEYAFTTDAGETIVRKSPISASEYPTIEPGNSIPVVYDPRSPGFSRLRTFLVDRRYLDRD